MRRDIELEHYGRPVGSINFVESPERLSAHRTASGFEMRVPIVINFDTVKKDDPLPMVGNFRGEVFAKDISGALMVVGRVWSDSWETGNVYYSEESSPSTSKDHYLIWAGALADLALFERARDGRSPALAIRLSGEFCHLLTGVHPHFRVRTEPRRIYSRSGNIEVTYPKEVWVETLRVLGVAENVLVEIPLPGRPSPEWDDVWKALVEARNAFEQGGSSGWVNCVRSARLALEKWQQHEAEDKGPGWVSPSRADREARTKKQRLDNIRWHLYQLAHKGVHTGAEEWTRDDALLMLSTLSALLAERKP